MADALSQLPQYHSKQDVVIQPLIVQPSVGCNGPANRVQELDVDDFRCANDQDEWIKKNAHVCSWKDGLVWMGDKLYVPFKCRPKVFTICHDTKRAGHFGFLKTLHLARYQFWWPNKRSDVEKYVQRCEICTKSKPRIGKPMGLLQSVSDPTQPWQDIAMDFIVDLPNSNVVWTVIDLFSNRRILYLVKVSPQQNN
uniref:Gypsy retrotransposon integrase-like protein 1 n=1 Tax=Micrurus paraensis TaxID=1970185 RepID=A0A2D4L3V4_9SAUR